MALTAMIGRATAMSGVRLSICTASIVPGMEANVAAPGRFVALAMQADLGGGFMETE